jgi:hypothetical protein
MLTPSSAKALTINRTSLSLDGAAKGFALLGSGNVREGGNCFSKFCCNAPASTAAKAKEGRRPWALKTNSTFGKNLIVFGIAEIL